MTKSVRKSNNFCQKSGINFFKKTKQPGVGFARAKILQKF